MTSTGYGGGHPIPGRSFEGFEMDDSQPDRIGVVRRWLYRSKVAFHSITFRSRQTYDNSSNCVIRISASGKTALISNFPPRASTYPARVLR